MRHLYLALSLGIVALGLVHVIATEPEIAQLLLPHV